MKIKAISCYDSGYDYGLVYAAQKPEATTVPTNARQHIDIPEADYSSMVDSDIDPERLEYWDGFNDGLRDYQGRTASAVDMERTGVEYPQPTPKVIKPNKPGRPKVLEEAVTVSIMLDKRDLVMIDDMANQYRVTRSEAIRWLIRYGDISVKDLPIPTRLLPPA